MPKYQITCYCYHCNGDNDNTKSGEPAEEDYKQLVILINIML